MLQSAANEHRVMKFGEPPAATANIPVMNNVMLKHHLEGIQSKQLTNFYEP